MRWGSRRTKCLRHIQALNTQCLAVFKFPEQGHSARNTAPEVTLVSDLTPPPVMRPVGCRQLYRKFGRVIFTALIAHGRLVLIPKGALVKEDKKDIDTKVCTITLMFLSCGPSLKGVEGRKGLVSPVHSGCLVCCGADTDKSLESMEATEKMEKGTQGVTLTLVCSKWWGGRKGQKSQGPLRSGEFKKLDQDGAIPKPIFCLHLGVPRTLLCFDHQLKEVKRPRVRPLLSSYHMKQK